MTIGIYCIINSINGKKYIGKSINIEKRWRHHKAVLCSANCAKNINKHLWGAVKQYGFANFKFIILDEFLEHDHILLSKLESAYIKIFEVLNPEFGYNLTAETFSGKTPSAESRLKMSISGKLRPPRSEETGRKISEALRGKPKTQEHCDKLSKAFLGRTGYKHTQEAKDKISKSKLGAKNYSYGKKARNFGMKHTEESKLKMSLSQTGRKASEETKQKQSIARKGNRNRERFAYEQYLLTGELINVWSCKREIEENTSFHTGHISEVCNGHSKTHGGFVWKKVLK